MIKYIFILLSLCVSLASYAVINGSAVSVTGTTLCNNGATEKTFAGTMTTNCGNGWSVGALADAPTGSPILAFSDLISGPDTGLGDSLGSGVIVTVWGWNLGSPKGSSTIEYCDSLSVCREGHVYYWKNADGTLPGGPANLHESHGMQEIAFSIPDSALGLGRIKVVVGATEAVTNTGGALSFTARAGNIYHVATGGSNASACTFAAPCEYINGNINPSASTALGNSNLSPGDTVYSHGVTEPTFSGGGNDAGMYLRSILGTAINPITIAAYPDGSAFSKVVSDTAGVKPYLSTGIVLSKYIVTTGFRLTEDPITSAGPYSNGIALSRYGRTVGNLLNQTSGTCITGQSGAIASGGDGAGSHKVFGNHLEGIGCDNTSHYYHTMYISIREEGITIQAPEVSYNYLKDNKGLFGIHLFDQSYSGDCGDMQGTIKVNNNVVVNQRGAAIDILAYDLFSPINACWTANIEVNNNVLVNSGIGVVADDNITNPDAIRIGGGIASTTVSIKNNTIYGWGEDSSFQSSPNSQAGAGINIEFDDVDPAIAIDNNVFVQTTTNSLVRWITSTEPSITYGKNSWWNTVSLDTNSAPTSTGDIVTSPLLTITGSQISVGAGSPLISVGTTPLFSSDIYGQPRGTTLGALE